MSESLKPALKAAVLRMLEPLTSLLLEAGLGVGDLNALSRIALVRAAEKQVRGSGAGKPSVSRLAVLTGLTRAEVKRILAGSDVDSGSDRGKQRAERVLSGWWHDPDFQDARGEPVVLPLRGKGRSFISLVERYGGEAVLSAPILDALLRTKAVRRRADGKLQAVSRTYAAVRWSAEGVEAIGQQVGQHLETLIHNLRSPADAWYVGQAVNARVDPKYIPVLMRDIREQSEGLIEGTDRQLNSPIHTVRGRASAAEAKTLGLGVYVYRAEEDEDARLASPTKRTAKRRRVKGR